MSKSVGRHFSPFYKVKKIIWVFRFGFGFPLTATNEAYNNFKFNAWLEFLRYIAYSVLLCFSGFYAFYVSYRCTKEWNPIRSLEKIWGGIGLSYLDIGVLLCISPINNSCNALYTLFFRRGVTGINKLLLNLTILNEKFHKILIGNRYIEIKTRKKQFQLYLKHFFLFIIGIMASIIMSISWESTMFDKYPNVLTVGEKVVMVIILILSNLSFIYPPMAKSTDFL